MAFLCCQQQNTVSNDTDKLHFDKIIAGMSTIIPTSIPSNSDIDINDTDKSLIKNHNPNQRNLTLCQRIPIIHPFGPFRFIWNSFVILALLYTSIAVPYTLTFGVMLSLSDPSGIITLLIDIFLLMDIVITFRTAYVDKYDHLHLVTSPKHIAKQYLKSWFWLDLISSFPFEFVIPVFVGQTEDKVEFIKVFRIFRLLRGLKMLRVLRIFKVFRGFHRYAYVREAAMVLKCVRCLAAMLITSHYFACFWYLVGYHTQKNGEESWLQVIEAHHENPTNFTKYSYSWYWAIVTLFTTGYGDIHAYNEFEQWTASICILIGTCFFAYFIGVLTTLLAEGDRVRMYELERVEEAQLFCSHHRIPRPLARAIVTHIRYHCNYNYLFDHQRIMDSIPNYLQNHVTEHLAHSLAGLDMFKHLPLSVIGQIGLKMTSTSCNSGHTLFTKGELSHEFYIQRTGRSVLHRNTSLRASKKRILERGDVCGEYAILSGKHRDTLKCLTWSEFYVLDINDLLSVLRHNYIDPKTFHRAYRNIKTVLRKTLQKATKRTVTFSDKHCNDSTEHSKLIHELSPAADATHSTINHTYFDFNDANNTTYEKLHIPAEYNAYDANHAKNTKLRYQQLKKMNTSSKLSKTLSSLGSLLQRENSAGRHELVIKKPNALSMDVEKLDTAHHSFDYSDHEDSHFFSDIKSNHEHDLIRTISMNKSTRNEVIRTSRGIGSKFGGKKRRHKTVNTHSHGNNDRHNIGQQIADMIHGVKTADSSGASLHGGSHANSVEGSESISIDSNDNEVQMKKFSEIKIAKSHIIEMGKKSVTLSGPVNRYNRSHSGNITPRHELDIIKSNHEFKINNLEKVEEINICKLDNLPEITPTNKDFTGNKNEMDSDDHEQSNGSRTFLYSTKEINNLSLDNIDIT